ncbi:transcriptional regulator [Natribaculum luteum]|uniref:Transcriptional regulator n=1 Tax=Natribaculum luteum TaxID=1586232 RepID=A0ABD5NWX8_9EURY|nr:transcriptional regulator [Natribaculum luteum]
MDSRTQERVERWDSRPFDGGRDGLSDLADSGFSGAVTAAGTWLFMLNGRVVGVFDGSLEDFDAASGTVYVAPDPALPLLAAMKTRGGDTRAKYYTNDTPLSEVDQTLQDGSFTGYVELSENVLSGDYYVVYYGGRRMAAAYIGTAERLLTDEEAFERAADEVGIYEVIDVDVDVTDLREPANEPEPDPELESDPTPSSPDSSGNLDVSIDAVEEAEADATSSDVTVDDALDDTASDPAAPTDDAATGITTTDDQPTDASSPGITDVTIDPTGTESTTDGTPETTAATVDEPTEGQSASVADAIETADEADESDDGPTDPDLVEVEAAAKELDESGISWTADDEDETDGDATKATESTDADGGSDDSDLERQFEREEQWRETRSIPSIDPDNTSESAAAERGSASGRQRSNAASSSGSTGASAGPSERQRGPDQSSPSGSNSPRRESSVSEATAASPSTSPSRARDADDRTARIERLEERRDALEAQRDELAEKCERLQAENQELSATVDRLQSRIDDLERQLEQAQSADSSTAVDGVAGGTSLSPKRALAGTNLFVRYDSKSKPTLETAHGGGASPSEVASNLRLEHHTGFDDSTVTVDGQPYVEFLRETMEYQLVDWLTTTVLYEIRDTGRADGLGDLYDAIPRIDRAELHASIALEDDAADVPSEVTFDVVAFDKMGNPLIVANLNRSREPATREMLEELEATASALKANYPDLGAALVVTSSFFEPGALEVTEEATSSGFLSRGSKLSYVNLSRKQGYHLCLVEARSGGFHMNVPEL